MTILYLSLAHTESKSHLPSAAGPGVGSTPHPTGGVPLPIQSKDALVTGSNRLRPRHSPADNNTVGGTGSDSGFSEVKEFLKVPVAETLAVCEKEGVDGTSMDESENPYATTVYYKSLRSPPLQTEYMSLQPTCCQEVQNPEHIYEEPTESSSDDGLHAPLTLHKRLGMNSTNSLPLNSSRT